MSILHYFCFLLLCCTYRSNAESTLFGDIDRFFKFFHFTTEAVDNFADLYEELTDSPLHLKRSEKRLLDKMDQMTVLINRVETNIPLVTVTKIEQMEHNFKTFYSYESELQTITSAINQIENSYELFLSLKEKLAHKMVESTIGEEIALNASLVEFANSVKAIQGESVRNSLLAIHNKIDLREAAMTLGKRDFFTSILNYFNEGTSSRCNIEKSPQQLIFDTLTSFRLTQLKGLAMTEYAYIILQLYTKGDYREYANKFRSDMLKRFDKQADIAMRAIGKADNSYWRCDPEVHKPEQTYTEVTRLLQGYVHNERELNPRRSCTEGCPYYKAVEKPDCSLSEKLCRHAHVCAGRVFDCKYVRDDLHICFSDVSSRRYNYIQWSDGGDNFGNTSLSCSTYSFFEKYREFFKLFRCFYCFCLCDDETGSDRYFSLEEMTSDITQNKIVVGVRFAKTDRIIHLKVKQAELLPLGIVDRTNMSWVGLPRKSERNEKPKFHKLSYESRSFDLDDLFAPDNYLVTGVRMRPVGSHLNVEVRLTAFDFKTGQLYPNLTYWKGNDNTDVAQQGTTSRKELDLSKNGQLPTQTSTKSFPDSRSNTFIKFRPSDELLDAAQSTLPFIDTQAVMPNPPIPLVGLGIIHKGGLSTGGFIEPKVFTLNMAVHSLVNADGTAENEEVSVSTTQADE